MENVMINNNKSVFYFIGVSTSRSSVMSLFPEWIRELDLPPAEIAGYDIELNGPAEKYRSIVRKIKENDKIVGALVTSHKMDVFKHPGDLFDYLDNYARLLGEVSSISKRNGLLRGHAKNPISVGLALESFLPDNYWIKNPQAQVFIMGAGGSVLALSVYLTEKRHGKNIPSKIIISNRRLNRLEHCREVHRRLGINRQLDYVQVTQEYTNDSILKGLTPGSLIVNATGMGKDLPGSPLSNEVVFPENSYVWEFNYRGSLEFYHQALQQKRIRNLHVEDGWSYFIYGLTQVIQEVFNVLISPSQIERMKESKMVQGKV